MLPKQLCDKWAWVKWDDLGRPTRSEQQAAADYDLAVLEIKVGMVVMWPSTSAGAGM